MEQRSLYTELVDPIVPRKATPKERFEAFHRANPHVYDEIVRLARKAKAAGWHRWSTKAAFEVMRYKAMETTGESWKLNNSHTRFYSRLIMERVPDLEGFFETRERRMV